MTRVMQDSVNTAGFTAGADIYAGYVLSDDGEGYNNYASMVARFPNAQHLAICTRFNTSNFPTGNVCLDYENATTGTSAADAQEAVAWTQRMRAAGRVPWNYSNQSTWPALINAYTAANVAQPIWWVANTSTGPVMIPGAAAHQYTFNLPSNPYDTSIVAGFIPGFDGGNVTDPVADSALAAILQIEQMHASEVAPIGGQISFFSQFGYQLCPGTNPANPTVHDLLTSINASLKILTTQQPSTSTGPQSGTYTFTPGAGS